MNNCLHFINQIDITGLLCVILLCAIYRTVEYFHKRLFSFKVILLNKNISKQ